MGSSSKSGSPSPGYRYMFGLHIGVSRGPVDELVEIEAGGRTAWKGSVTSSTTIKIDAANLFGGDKGEGGISGMLDVMMGDADQAVNGRLSTMLGGLVSACRGVFTAYFDGQVTAINPYPKPWKFRVRRALKGWHSDVCWYPEKAKILMASGAIHAVNPAHVLFECLTNPDWGRGLSWSQMDLPAWTLAADTLFAEGFGWCGAWKRQTSVDAFMSEVMDTIGGAMYTNRQGLRTIKLARGGYDVEALPLFTIGTGLLDIEEEDNVSLETATNELIVTYRDPVTNQEKAVRWQNLAAIQAYGVKSETRSYTGVPTPDLAARVAERDGTAMTAGARVFRLKLDRRGYQVEPMGLFRISAPEYDIQMMVLRAGDVDDGKLEAGAIRIKAVQDVFGLPATAYVDDNPSSWAPPSQTPVAVGTRKLTEVTWRDLAFNLAAADLSAVDPQACYVAALARKPSSMSLGVDLASRVGAAAFQPVITGGFCPTAQISIAVGPMDTSVLLTNYLALGEVQQGDSFLLDDEWCRLDNLVADTTNKTITMTFARGCIDTVPAAHAAGARLWFGEEIAVVDPTEYVAGVSVDVKLLTRTSTGVLDVALAPTDTLVTRQRQHRPYPPGQFRINAAYYPPTSFARIAVSGVHRDRKLQADQLVASTAPGVGPEPGTTYRVRIYQQPSTLLHTESGLVTPNFTYDVLLDADASIRVELESVRDGLASYQMHSHVLACECGNKALNGTFASDTVWNKGTGWTIAAGVASKAAGSASALSQGITLVAGGLYRIDYTLSGVSGGGVAAGFSGGSGVTGLTRTANGAYTETLTAGAGNTTFELAANSAFAGNVDNVAVRRLT
jgi:hypothetical protein